MDDEYAEDEFEASVDGATAPSGRHAATDAGAHGEGYVSEEELRPPASAGVTEEAPRQRSRALQDALAVDDAALLASVDDEYGSHANGSDDAGNSAVSRSRVKRKNASASVHHVSGRHLLDNSLWTFSICATRIRALQVPVATRLASTRMRAGDNSFPPAIRELRVFATLDRQAMQSHGSEWKREPRPETPTLQKNLRERATRTSAKRASPGGKWASPSPTPSTLGRRSGFLDEASWRRDHGTLRWTFPKETFRKLKAATPRVKVLVFGIGENAVDATVRKLSEESAHAHSESIVSFGWFFLDLRTPDLPEKWFKLQNSRFGGEILIYTAFVPVGTQQHPIGLSPSRTQTQLQTVERRTLKSELPKQQPAPVPIHVPIAVEDGEFLRLGSRQGADIFVISVFLQAAFNLAEVVETTLGSQKSAPESYKGGFWFSYSLFEVVVRTDVFFNLDVSEFSPIRDSFRVMSCVEDLAEFCRQQTLAVYLCTYNRVLGGVEIPFSDLLTGELFVQSSRTKQAVVGSQAVVEGNFAFPSTNGPFIDASLVVKCVQTAAQSTSMSAQASTRVLQPETKQREQREAEDENLDAPSITSLSHLDVSVVEEPQEPPTVPIRVSLDQIRLSTGAVSEFVGEESISIEISVGDTTSSAPVRFHAFLKDHVLGDNDSLQLLASNLTFEELQQSQITVRCYSSESKRHVGRAQAALPSNFTRIPASPLCLEIPVYAKGNELVGQCTLRLEVIADGDDYVSTRQFSKKSLTNQFQQSGGDRDVHVFRVFLQLKSLRDFEENAQELTIAYQNPFTGRGKVEMPDVKTVNRGEVLIKDAFCVFELIETEEQVKLHMQAPVAIDFLAHSSDGRHQAAGSAVFSLNFLYFSQEQFCCAASSCGFTFRSRAEGEAHFEEAHEFSAEDRSDKDRVHLFKSCVIELPVISLHDADKADVAGTSGLSPRRIGTIRVVAYVEDMGVLSEEDALVAEKMFVPQSWTRENGRLYDNFTVSTTPPSASKKASDEKRVASMIEARDYAPTPSLRAAGSSTVRREDRREVVDHTECENEKAHTIAQLKKSFEREKQLWVQEQQQSEQLQWKRRFEAMEKARMSELEDEWARREEERSSLLRLTQAEYERLEKALRTSLLELEARERRLAIAENSLQREQQAQRDEAEQFRKRLQSDHTHALSLASKQADAQEKRIALLEKQLSDAEKRARQVEADFAEYRLQQRKVPESRLREEISALKGAILELEKQKMHQEREKDAAEANVTTLKLQLEKLAKLVQQEKKKNEIRVVEELEKLRMKYVAREEKYVLDGDREELRAIKKQLDELKGLNLRPTSGYDDFDVEAPQLQPQHQSSPFREQFRGPPRRTQRHATQRRYRTHQCRVENGGGDSSSHLSSRSNWTSQFSLLNDDPELRRRFRVAPSEVSISHDEHHHRHYRMKSLNGSSSVRSNSSSQHYEHEDDDGDDEEGKDEMDEGFDDHDSDQGDENEAQLLNVADTIEIELDRLERERKLLLMSGAYNEQSFLVRELTRRIEATKARSRHHDSPL